MQASPSGQPSFVSPAAWADHCTAYDSRTSHHQPPSPQCSRSLSSLRKSTCIDTVNCFSNIPQYFSVIDKVVTHSPSVTEICSIGYYMNKTPLMIFLFVFYILMYHIGTTLNHIGTNLYHCGTNLYHIEPNQTYSKYITLKCKRQIEISLKVSGSFFGYRKFDLV